VFVQAVKGADIPVRARILLSGVKSADALLEFDTAVFGETSETPNPQSVTTSRGEVSWLLRGHKACANSIVQIRVTGNEIFQMAHFSVQVTNE
jgi:hypothetical protein